MAEPIQKFHLESPAIVEEMKLPPSTMLLICVAPCGKANFEACAIAVCRGDIAFIMYSVGIIMIVEVMVARTTLLRTIGTIIATMKGMVARSPKGRT